MSDKDGGEAPAKRLPLRWLTLAEIVGVAALVIAGLGYWDSHRERIDQERSRAADQRLRDAELKAAARSPAFLLTATPEDDGKRLRIASVHAEQVIQTQTFWFPAAIRADSVQTTGNPRLQVDWFDDGLRKAAGKDKRGRLPVAVTTVFIEDGETRSQTALYQVGYSLHSRTFQSARVELEGLSLARANLSGSPQAAADSLWAAR